MVNLDQPRDRDSHTIADFAELLCLLSLDRVCSRESIRDRMKDVGDAQIKDDELEDCFSQLTWRVEAFGQAYPFELLHGRVLHAPDDLSDWQKLYVLLLMCANLPFLRGSTPALTQAFERIALQTLTTIWPASGKVRPFGKNETDFTGDKWERINALATEIGARGLCTAETFRQGDSGDGGIDLMAALPLDKHESRHIPSLLSQCACSRDEWVTKQMSIANDRLSGQIAATHPWMQAIMIPQSFRDSRGRWAIDGDVGAVILFDRLRILMPLGPEVNWAPINPPDTLNRFLDERLPLV